MLSNKRRLELLEGKDRGGLPLVNSIRRGEWLKNREQRERQKLGASLETGRERYFPDEYGKTVGDKVAGTARTIEDKQQAGVVNLQVMQDRSTPDEKDRSITIAGKVYKLKSGSLRIIDRDVISGMLSENTDRREQVDTLLGVILEAGTEMGDELTRYILDKTEFNQLPKGSGDEFVLGAGAEELRKESGLPSVFLTYPPSSVKFQLGLHKLRLILQKSSSIIDQSIEDWKKKYVGEVRDLVRAEAFNM